jgi:cytochrome c556
MNAPVLVRLSLAAALSLSAVPALAQTPADEAYQQQQQDYQARQSQYQDDVARYQAQQQTYRLRRDHYEADRAAYDAEHGSGTFFGYYRRHPYQYDEIYGPGAWERDFGAR